MARDEPAGIERSKCCSTGAPALGGVDAPAGYANVTSRRRISRAGVVPAGRSPERSAPAGRIAGSSRSTAATGAAAPSRAQLNPPDAIIDTPTALVTYPTASPRPQRPRAGPLPRNPHPTAYAQ